MPSLFAAIHIPNKPNESSLALENIDLEKNVTYLKQEIAAKLQYDANKLEIIYNGYAMEDDTKLSDFARPDSTVHCFGKTKKFETYKPSADVDSVEAIARVQELYNVIAHIQIPVNSRVNVLQKVLAEYPEFRRNLGAQALIRDSVLFNTLHQPEVVKNIAQHYPIICEVAPYIVDTIKKELIKTATNSLSEPATDSTNSSEEENSLGASSNNGASTSERANVDTSQAENPSVGLISRQQLQAALAQAGYGSANSLTNIAQRNTDAATTGGASSSTSLASLSSSTSGDRISAELLRNQLQRAISSLNTASSSGNASAPQQMDTSESNAPVADNSMNSHDVSIDDSGDIPTYYRTHQYVEQLRTMAQMGFVNYEENLTYLNLTNGNIENAINLLMGAMN